MSNNITHYDDFIVWDKLKFHNKKSGHFTHGWVRVFIDDELIHDGPNLIVGNGRSYASQLLFPTAATSDGSVIKNLSSYKISHFAVGSGGVDVSGESIVYLGPDISDNSLGVPIGLGNEAYLDEPSGYVNMNESPLIHTHSNAIKPINEYVREPMRYGGSESYYTKVKCTCIIPPGEPSALQPGTSVKINEAGLYMTNTDLTDIVLFARICFDTKNIELESSFKIYWYNLC